MKKFLFSTWYTKLHQYFRSSTLAQYSTRTFIHQFDLLQKVFSLSLNMNCFHLWLLRQRNQKSVPFEKMTVLVDLEMLPRISFMQIQASNYVIDFFHCGPDPQAGSGPRVPGDRVRATSSSSELFLICKINRVNINSLNAFSLLRGRTCYYELFHLKISDCSNL